MSHSKSEEIAILTAAAKKLGSESYTGPWLSKVLPQLEQDMKNDFMPDFDWHKAARECTALKEEAKAEAARMIQSAKDEAQRIRERAQSDLIEMRASCGRSLLRAARELGVS